jgi:16S rRNA (uracil1498-N3)-methyltransferase
LFYETGIAEGVSHLNPEESRHCTKVLRKTIGDTIHIGDGHGHMYTAEITETKSYNCYFRITGKTYTPPENFRIHLALAPTKNIDRTEWFLEKAVEIGVHEISFVACQNSERRHIKLDRLEKKALSACKQSIKLYLPKINKLLPFHSFIESAKEQEKYLAHLDLKHATYLPKASSPGKSYLLLVGPEGDFTNEEIMLARSAGMKLVHLGKQRLRTETAGVVACQMLNQVNASF